MLIKKVEISNFYSYKHAEVDFTKYSGIVYLNGKNKDTGGGNGSGKSSILESIVWGIFGRGIRKTTEEAVVNVDEGRNCSVTLEIFKPNVGEIKIVRARRPSSLKLFINEELVIKESSTKTQELIEETLGTDYKSFLSFVVFGQHLDVEFLSASPEEKRNIIRSILNLDNLFSLRDRAKEFKSTYTGEIKSLIAVLEDLEKQKSTLTIPDKKYKLVELPKLADIITAEKKVVEIKNKIKKLQGSFTYDTAKSLNDKISKGVYTENKNCPICKNSYVISQDEKDVKNLIHQFSETMYIHNKEQAQLKILQEELEQTKPKISSVEWDKWNEKNKLIEQALQIQEKYDGICKQIEELQNKKSTSEKMLEVMRFWEKAFSEQGVIKYIIQNILDFLNEKINFYLSVLTNNQISLLFNNELDETIVSNNRIISYISLSGGEKRKVNLSTMLAFQDLQNKISKNSCNLIFFDEVAENLDADSIVGVYNLLSLIKTQNRVILLITHNENLRQMLESCQVIKIVKENGESRILEDGD